LSAGKEPLHLPCNSFAAQLARKVPGPHCASVYAPSAGGNAGARPRAAATDSLCAFSLAFRRPGKVAAGSRGNAYLKQDQRRPPLSDRKETASTPPPGIFQIGAGKEKSEEYRVQTTRRPGPFFRSCRGDGRKKKASRVHPFATAEAKRGKGSLERRRP